MALKDLLNKGKEAAMNIGENAAKDNFIGRIVGKKDTEEKDTVEESDEEKGSKMLQVMDWAFDKATGNIPGFGSVEDTASKYMEKNNGNVEDAVNQMIRWQMTSAATTGFVTSLGGLPTMVITLPANVAGVMAIQLRMIGCVAHLGGCNFHDEDTKTGMYLCLLGSQGADLLSKAASQFAVKFTTAALKKLPGKALTKINQAVGFRLVTKFGTKGVVNLGKAIPFVGGVVGGTVDAISTWGIANAAKALFLRDLIEGEKQEKMEMVRIRSLMNLAMCDGKFDTTEKELIASVIDGLNVSDKAKSTLVGELESPIKKQLDLSLFKEDTLYSSCLLSSLVDVANVDGNISGAEKLYINSIGKELGYSPDDIKLIMQ